MYSVKEFIQTSGNFAEVPLRSWIGFSGNVGWNSVKELARLVWEEGFRGVICQKSFVNVTREIFKDSIPY